MSSGYEGRPQVSFWSKFLKESSFLRQYIWKYRKLVGIGLLALLIVDGLEVILPIFLKGAVDVTVERKPHRYLLFYAAAYFVTTLMQGVGRYAWRMYLIRSSILSGRDLRQHYANHLFRLSTSFFDKRRIGDLMSLATNDVDAIRMAIGSGLLTFADSLFYFLWVPLAMFMLSPKLALLSFIPLPLIPWIVFRNEREIHSRFEKVQESFSKLAALAQENLNGMRVVKAFACEDAQMNRFREAGQEYIDLNLHLAKVQNAFGPTLDFTMSMGLVLLLFVGGQGVIHDTVTLGTFVAFQRYIQKMIWPMSAMGMAVTYYQRAVASSERMKAVLAEYPDIKIPENPKLPLDYFPSTPQVPWRTRGKIEFRNLSFKFPGTEQDCLQGISLTIQPGERVAFVGPIGSGKSAILALLPRLYPVQSGMILIDEVDINDWPIEELRRQVGYVSQEVFLFSETVVENVAFGLGESTSFTFVEEATRLASVHEEIQNWTASYHTRLGERGANLSGGQKQRLTIARALAKTPSILVLDDALSSVDVQTEEKILRSLRSRSQRNTELISAHRISTVKDADRIVVLEGGKIQLCR